MTADRAAPRQPAAIAAWTAVAMDTLVTIRLPVRPECAAEWEPAVTAAVASIRAVEAACTRFDKNSEVAALLRAAPGTRVTVSPALFAALSVAVELSRVTDGAFDPTVGARQEQAGFDRNWRTGERIGLAGHADPRASYQDIHLDAGSRTVRMGRPALLDLGAVAKGLAADLAARCLAPAPGAAVDIGGDCVLAGQGPAAGRWPVAISHPRQPGAYLARLSLGEGAIATSGDYRRQGPGGAPHIRDARRSASGQPGSPACAASVVAPTGLLADGLATAACLLPLSGALALLAACDGVEALLVGAAGTAHTTPGWGGLAAGPVPRQAW